jgi:hypothetical protein
VLVFSHQTLAKNINIIFYKYDYKFIYNFWVEMCCTCTVNISSITLYRVWMGLCVKTWKAILLKCEPWKCKISTWKRENTFVRETWTNYTLFIWYIQFYVKRESFVAFYVIRVLNFTWLREGNPPFTTCLYSTLHYKWMESAQHNL